LAAGFQKQSLFFLREAPILLYPHESQQIRGGKNLVPASLYMHGATPPPCLQPQTFLYFELSAIWEIGGLN
jgi:hypothetical protein